MRARLIAISLLTLVGITFVGTSVKAINISLQYPPGDLFSATLDPTAKAAINAAAADLSAAITTSLNAINTDVYTGTNVSTNAIFDWYYSTTNPTTGFVSEIFNATIPANDVIIQVGSRSLAGSTLSMGGPAGLGFSASGTGFPSQWLGAMASVESQSEAAYKRSGGPVIGTVPGSFTLGGTTASFSIDYGAAYGSIALDKDSSSEALLSNYWHFNHTTPVAAGKNDLYSTALHSMVQALGFGASESWNSNRIGSTWIGPEVIALQGSGNFLVTTSHIAEGIISTRISDGVLQEVAMDSTIANGTRKYLTALDLAFLRDIGYSTIIPAPPVPEPSAMKLLVAVGIALSSSRRR
jgi:hypothetical protein